MKITLENLENGKAKLSLELNGKTYDEVWEKKGRFFITDNAKPCIFFELNNLGRDSGDTELEDFLSSINIETFIRLANKEE